MAYDKNRWELFDKNKPNEDQPHSFITKRKLDHIEEGIAKASMDLEIGEVKSGDEADAFITEDPENNRKLLHITFPPAGKGDAGEPGQSAYELWLSLGNVGTEQDFLDYLKGIDGRDGKDGAPGKDGEPGPKGDSAYQTWLALGNTGTEQDFINAMRGPSGEAGKSVFSCIIPVLADSQVSRTDITDSALIKVGDTLIDSNGSVYSIQTVTETVVTVGKLLFSIKGERGPQGEPGQGIDGSSFVRF